MSYLKQDMLGNHCLHVVKLLNIKGDEPALLTRSHCAMNFINLTVVHFRSSEFRSTAFQVSGRNIEFFLFGLTAACGHGPAFCECDVLNMPRQRLCCECIHTHMHANAHTHRHTHKYHVLCTVRFPAVVDQVDPSQKACHKRHSVYTT